MTIPGPVTGGGQLGYDPAAMRTGLSAIDTASAEVSTLLTSIQSEVDALTATWHGPSNTAFTGVHQRWAQRAADIDSALRVMRDKLAATDAAYTGTEQTQVDQYVGLGHRI